MELVLIVPLVLVLLVAVIALYRTTGHPAGGTDTRQGEATTFIDVGPPSAGGGGPL